MKLANGCEVIKEGGAKKNGGSSELQGPGEKRPKGSNVLAGLFTFAASRRDVVPVVLVVPAHRAGLQVCVGTNQWAAAPLISGKGAKWGSPQRYGGLRAWASPSLFWLLSRFGQLPQ